MDRREMDNLFRELGRLQAAGVCADLLQYRSLVTAHQYCGLLRLVASFVAPGSEVLDWGCGNGHFSWLLTRLGHRVTGFSFGDFELRSRFPPTYRFALGNGEEPSALPFEDGRFDCVVSVGVLEHVRETGGREEDSLAEIARVLRPGGRFLCYHLPNRASWIEGVAARVPGVHHHQFRYTPNDIRRLCDGAGLDCLLTRRYGMLPRNLWHRAPSPLRDSSLAAALWDAADALLRLPLGVLAQNHLFVAERPAATAR